MVDNMFATTNGATGANAVGQGPCDKNKRSGRVFDAKANDKDAIEALYISFQTLGFNDYTPANTYCEVVVMVELASGMLLLIGALSLLLSRISDYD